MLKHILVPLDGSELAERALEQAYNVVQPGGKITLISVIEPLVDYAYAMGDLPVFMVNTSAGRDQITNEPGYKNGQEYLTRIATRLKAKGYQASTVIDVGDPATCIVDRARLEAVDAIVISTHGRTGLSRLLFGSVTQAIISKMPCPTFIVPGFIREEADQPLEYPSVAPAT